MNPWQTLATGILFAMAACEQSSAPPAAAAPSDHSHSYVECNDPGHPPFRSDSHPSRELSEDDARIHTTKYPGHHPVIRQGDHP